ncbi:DUF6273 domain-containing protein [Treponema sp.]|uniref:DUF6273 domain-containing protein n=1 Tax=Treponema sp. TaxID=166 RepID=UPI00298DBE90|nr:DUF6273 domain-containing protein [Treponema sp.]MCR5612697.1 DUF6273 domain-containing protein [Treponema sp.]
MKNALKYMALFVALLTINFFISCSNAAGGGGSSHGFEGFTITAESGFVSADKTTAIAGEQVILTITDPQGIVNSFPLVVIGEDGSEVELSGTGDIRTFIMPGQKVCYKLMFEGTTSYNKIGTKTAKDVEYDIVEFGDWPQTIMPNDGSISVDETKFVICGEFRYYLGSDCNFYVKAEWGNNDYRWYKVEPIKWRVLTTNYNGTNKKLLLAEDILERGKYDSESTNYETSEIRKWLNSNTTCDVESDHSDSVGFLNTAFDKNQRELIASTSVDNSARSTQLDNPTLMFGSGESLSPLSDEVAKRYYNPDLRTYINTSDTPTIDKIFLLSRQEATKREYGFYEGLQPGTYSFADPDRFKKTTNYEGRMGGEHSWWLRSPDDLANPTTGFTSHNVVCVDCGGANFYQFSTDSGTITTNHKPDMYLGVVPALCVEN